MLIEFTVANFRSVRDSQTFSLMKAKGDELEHTNTFTKMAFNEFTLLRSAAIYGPNAGGKTNFLQAIRTMQKIVVKSASEMHRGDELPVIPFLLDNNSTTSPTEFEVVFIVNDVRYQYGFSTTQTQIHEEWLLAYPNGRPQRWVDRKWDEDNETYIWDIGPNLSGEKQLWKKSTRNNALFLSTAVQLNSKQLQPIFDWFNNTIKAVNVGGLTPGYSAGLCMTEEKTQIMDFLQAADIGIDDIEVEENPFNPDKLPKDTPNELKTVITRDLKDKKIATIKALHKNTDGDLVSFDLKEESDGTQKLFSFSGPWIDTLKRGLVLFIDELHDNLHPSLVRFLVQLFHNTNTNPNNAQLIFTTHETSILSQDIFRRDQIWFCQKDSNRATTLYPLTDFGPRKGRENLELAYLSGCYGALPYTRTLKKPA